MTTPDRFEGNSGLVGCLLWFAIMAILVLGLTAVLNHLGIA